MQNQKSLGKSYALEGTNICSLLERETTPEWRRATNSNKSHTPTAKHVSSHVYIWALIKQLHVLVSALTDVKTWRTTSFETRWNFSRRTVRATNKPIHCAAHFDVSIWYNLRNSDGNSFMLPYPPGNETCLRNRNTIFWNCARANHFLLIYSMLKAFFVS